MNRFLLDTTFLIDAERSAAAIEQEIGDEDDLAIAAITLAELLVGVELATGRRRLARRAFVEEVKRSIHIVAYDAGVAKHHASLLVSVRKSGRPRGAHNLLIAATAIATGRTVLTADPLAFAELPGVLSRSHR